MDEYVDREALYEKAYWHGEHPDVGNPFPNGVDAIDIKDVDAIPAADVAPVRHGRWMNANSRPKTYWRKCTVCGGLAYFCGIGCSYNYCPNCGAKMDGGDNE